jgi:Arc/MetJ family transcription regulator
MQTAQEKGWAVARRFTGLVTEAMREHYSSVALDEKRAAVSSVLRALPKGESADDGADAPCE